MRFNCLTCISQCSCLHKKHSGAPLPFLCTPAPSRSCFRCLRNQGNTLAPLRFRCFRGQGSSCLRVQRQRLQHLLRRRRSTRASSCCASGRRCGRTTFGAAQRRCLSGRCLRLLPCHCLSLPFQCLPSLSHTFFQCISSAFIAVPPAVPRLIAHDHLQVRPHRLRERLRQRPVAQGHLYAAPRTCHAPDHDWVDSWQIAGPFFSSTWEPCIIGGLIADRGSFCPQTCGSRTRWAGSGSSPSTCPRRWPTARRIRSAARSTRGPSDHYDGRDHLGSWSHHHVTALTTSDCGVMRLPKPQNGPTHPGSRPFPAQD